MGELRRIVRDHAVLGRISAEDKRRVVEALRDDGRYVAMIGDGVNDVPALKASRLAIAQGAGTQMARSVADVVLVRGEFAAVPAMVAEGRKILRNVQRVAKLFVTKSAFAAFLVLSIGLTPTAYPLLPRQLTLAAAVTIGIPGFFLALSPSSGRYSSTGFLRELARFAVPAGTAAGLGVLSSYLFALNVLDLQLDAARTVAVTVLVFVGLYLILALEATGRVRGTAISALCLALLATYLVLLAFPSIRHFFQLGAPTRGGHRPGSRRLGARDRRARGHRRPVHPGPRRRRRAELTELGDRARLRRAGEHGARCRVEEVQPAVVDRELDLVAVRTRAPRVDARR